MPDLDFIKSLCLQPLDTSSHDRAAFSCQEDRINRFLKKSANQQSKQDITKPYVAVPRTNPADRLAPIIGFYAINTHSIDVTELPEEATKKLPRYETISAIYISAIGVTEEHQGKGLGTFLMADAFQKCVEVAEIVGSRFVVLDALNEDAARLYERLGFHSLPSKPERMIQTMQAIRNAITRAAD